MPRIYNPDGTFREVEHINAYLLPGSDIYVTPRAKPLCSVPQMTKGSTPIDGGNLILSEDEKNYFVKKYPQDAKFVRQLLGAEEFIHNKKRYCLWLVDATPAEIKNNKFIYERVKAVKESRLKSKREATRKKAETPHLFAEIRQPTSNYILVPSVSSERRKYIPMGFVSPEIICSNLNLMIPDAEIWHFGILTSKVHMIWTKTICGRLESRIRYSAKIVYNNFMWHQMYPEQFVRLMDSSKKILAARKNYPDSSLADLYDDLTMPKDLREAHRQNDEVVMDIYSYDDSWSEEEIAIDLLERYQSLLEYIANRPKITFREDEDFDE